MTVSPYPDRGVVQAANLAALYADGEVFPFLPGQDFVQSKAPNFSTGVHQTASGAEVRASFWPGPIYSFKVQFNVLRDRAVSTQFPNGSEVQELLAFFNARLGRYGFFYYFDPNDNNVPSTAPQTIATGDGSTTTFQFYRSTGFNSPFANIEPVYALLNPPTVTVGGAAKTYGTDYTVSPWGVLTFTTAPAASAVIKWYGQFLFVCRFDQDKMELVQLYKDLWSQAGLEFMGITPG